MVKANLLDPAWQVILNIKLAPAVARLAATPAERRHPDARHALLRRIRGEFEEMPGLSLTVGQAARLFSLPLDVTGRILGGLTEADVLRRKNDGRFALPS
jgi:hypothetical protein